MRDSFEPLIPLNGCKDTHFPVNNQIFPHFFCGVSTFLYSSGDFSNRMASFSCLSYRRLDSIVPAWK